MSQCVRCNQPCQEPSSLCDQCQSLASHFMHIDDGARSLRAHTIDVSAVATSPLAVVSAAHDGQSNNGNSGVAREPLTPPPLHAVNDPLTPPPVVPDTAGPGGEADIFASYSKNIDLTLHKLSDAARRIAAAKQGTTPVSHAPRASRLAPLRDVSLDIRRDSTPLPRTAYSTEPERRAARRSGIFPDFWPFLADGDDEAEPDIWNNTADPLQARHLPSSVELQQIDETGQNPTLPVAPTRKTHYQLRHRQLRVIFTMLAVLAIFALAVDTLLVSFAVLNHPHTHKVASTTPPSLTLSPSVVNYGDTVTASIRGFSSDAHVLLSRDVEETVETRQGGSVVQLPDSGSLNVPLTVGTAWGPGFHTIEAEDVSTRYTASATLRIAAGPTRPAQLLLSTTSLDLGTADQGATTIQPLTLQNTGGGSISWSASSDQSWLSISPDHGVLSGSQSCIVGASRVNLSPGNYSGTITIASNVGSPMTVAVQMSVRALPKNAGAALAVSPAVLSFTAVDGGANPTAQPLAVSNPGSQPLYWSLDSTVNQSMSSMPGLGTGVNWLRADTTSGVVQPGANTSITINVVSGSLLPGVYNATLSLHATNGHTALNSPQSISVSLTVQPRCSVQVNATGLSFTAVVGQVNPSSQAITLTSSASCPAATSWTVSSSASWLAVTPGGGQLKTSTNAVITASVNIANLKPNTTYNATISIAIAQQSTQSVPVQLTIQPPPTPTAPIVGASPLNLSFSTTQGQADPPAQTVTLTNTGQSPLLWHTSVALLASSWLGASPTGGTVNPGQAGQMVVTVSAASLTPGTYTGQISVSGVDGNNNPAGGSPQTITVTFVVLAPCTLMPPSSSSLAFTAIQGGSDPQAQPLTLVASGSCNWPLNWQANVTGTAPWLKLNSASGSFTNAGQSGVITVAPTISGLAPGFYRAGVAITAADASSLAAQGSPQIFSVSLNVQPPCSLHTTPSALTFAVAQGQTSAVQHLALSDGGTCSFPVAWTAAAAVNAPWLVLSATSGTDTGAGSSLNVSANAAQLAPGTYRGAISLSGADATSALVAGSPLTVSVSLTVTGSTVSGTVNGCSANPCTAPIPLAGAIVTLTNGTGGVVATATCDAGGNYSLANIASGSYTLSATGTDANSVNYSGEATVNVTANISVTVNAFAIVNATPPPISPHIVQALIIWKHIISPRMVFSD